MFVPHEPLPVEATFDRFISTVGGKRVTELMKAGLRESTADYVFPGEAVVAELKTLTTDFPSQSEYQAKIAAICIEAPERGTASLAQILDTEQLPSSLMNEYVQVFRPPLQRVLKKANNQLKSTRLLLGMPQASGIVLLVNDGLYGLPPQIVLHLACNILLRLYSGIDAFVYITVNQYVEVPGSDLANLLWVPQYSERAPDSLVAFVDQLGKQWGEFLGLLIGEFESSGEIDTPAALLGSRTLKRSHSQRPDVS